MTQDEKLTQKGYQPLSEGYKPPIEQPLNGHQPNTGQQKPLVPVEPPKNP